MKKVMFIASTGGHLSELFAIKDIFDLYDYHIVTELDDSTKGLKEVYDGRINFLVYGTKDYLLKYFFKFTFNILKSIYLFIKINPSVIVTTGTHTAVPMCYLAWIFRKKIIYIETFANRTTPTLSGRMVYPIATVFIIQWKQLEEFYPKAIYGGWIY